VETNSSHRDAKLIHTSTLFTALHPWFVTGFTDAEGCFLVSIIKDKEYRLGWSVSPRYHINLHQKDKAILEQIKKFFLVGGINKHGSESMKFRVESVKDLKVIINHFEKYPLITQKRADYELWKQVFYLVQNKEHLTREGLEKIVAIKASINNGLSDELKAAFPDTIPVTRPSIVDQGIKDPNWLAGFTSGEGCFIIKTNNSSSHRLGVQVQLEFILTQHSRDEELIISLVDSFDCGKCYPRSGKDFVEFKVRTISDITEKIIPFFQKYPIIGVKRLDFQDWCKIAELMKNKVHLTEEGLEQIRTIKTGMNKGRL
jgi:hypothetical protein